MAAVDLTVFDEALKTFYLPPIREQHNRATVLLNRLKAKKNVKVQGRNYVIPLAAKRNAGIVTRSAATKSNLKLPSASHEELDLSTWSMKYHYGRIEVTGPTVRSVKSDAGGFIDAVDLQLQGLQKSAPQDTNRQLWGDGVGQLAAVTATIDDTDTSVSVDTTKFLNVNQVVSILLNTDGTVLITTVTVTGITSATAFTIAATAVTVTLTTAGTIGIFCEMGDANSKSYRNAMTGLGAIVWNTNITNMSTTYVGAINRATAGNEFWKAEVMANSGTVRPITMGLLQQALLKPQVARFGGGKTSIIIGDADMWATIGNILAANKRWGGEKMTLDGGWQAIDFSGVPVVFDKDSPSNQLVYLDEEHLFFLTQSEWDFADMDGSMWKWVPDYDSFQTYMYMDKELGTDHPGTMVLLDDLDTNLS